MGMCWNGQGTTGIHDFVELVMGVPKVSILFYSEGAIWLAPLQIFLEHGALPQHKKPLNMLNSTFRGPWFW
jgi:hypothetical protein